MGAPKGNKNAAGKHKKYSSAKRNSKYLTRRGKPVFSMSSGKKIKKRWGY
jgi:hypothetical protein